MREEVFATQLRHDKAEALVVVEPLHNTSFNFQCKSLMFREKYSQGHYGPFLSIKIPLLRKDTFIATDGMPRHDGPDTLHDLDAAHALGETPPSRLITFVVEVVPLRSTFGADKRLMARAAAGGGKTADIAKADQPGVPLGTPLVLNDPAAVRAQRHVSAFQFSFSRDPTK